MRKDQWLAIKNKDASYDGQFVYVLKTTGTICRPSCDKKVSSPQNVLIFDTLEQAMAEGYHPCKRCRPDHKGWKGARQELADAVGKAIRENYIRDFSLQELAEKYYLKYGAAISKSGMKHRLAKIVELAGDNNDQKEGRE